MSDLSEYVAYRRVKDAESAERYDEGYQEFKVSVLLRLAREGVGLTIIERT